MNTPVVTSSRTSPSTSRERGDGRTGPRIILSPPGSPTTVTTPCATAVIPSRDPEKQDDAEEAKDALGALHRHQRTDSTQADQEPHANRPAPKISAEAKRRDRRRKIMAKLNPTMRLVNNGSVARDHLASERTFLAYVRTSLTFSSMGVALVQLLQLATTVSDSKSALLRKYGTPLGAITILVGLLTLFIGIARYFSVQKALVDGDVTIARTIIIFLGFVLAVVIVVVFGVLVGLD